MIRFLNKETILLFHDHQIETYGGSRGIRDEGLLESELALPQQSFGGEYVHKTIFEMAAAYGFHLCKNHPFIDGNERTALAAMFTFLHVNGWKINAEKNCFTLLLLILPVEN